MKHFLGIIIKPLLCLFLAYLGFIILFSTIPHIRMPKASASASVDTAKKQRAKTPGYVTLVESRRDAWNARMALVREAEVSLDIVYHTVHADRSGQAFWGEVVCAADRGVAVRILLDGKVGTHTREGGQIMRALDAHPNITCKRFNPASPLRPWKWHSLLHDKFILMDGQYALLGGRNIGDRYYGPQGYEGGLVEDRDVLVKGAVLPSLQAYMQSLWTSPDSVGYGRNAAPRREALMSLKEKAEAYESEHAAWYRDQIADYDLRMVAASDIQLLHNPIHTAQKEPKIGKALQARVLEARQSVAVQSPYITANPAFIDTLGQAAQNAEVHILTNSTDSTPNCLAYSDYDANRQAFIDTGATLYEYHSLGSIHGKSAVIDGRISAVGSLNLDDRSMYIDTESVLLIESPAFAQSLTDAMEALQYKSIPSTFSGGGMKVPTTKQKCLNMLSKIAGPLRFLI